MNPAGQAENPVAGYAMAALLVAIAVMAIGMTVALPAWRHEVQREKEEELIFRGRQYVRAIQLYQRKFAATYPADIDVLVKQRFLRKKYKDPMVQDGEFEILSQGSLVSITPGQGRGGLPQGQTPGRAGVTQGGQGVRPAGPGGGVLGVRSKSTETSIRTLNGATHYNEWQFLFMPATMGPGQGRSGMRGGPGGRGIPGMPEGRGGQRTGPRGGNFQNFPGSTGERGGATRGGRGQDR